MRMRATAVNLLNLFVGVVELGLGLRFIFKLFGANAAQGFVSWVYEMTSGLLDPFRGIFPTKVFENHYVLEFTTLFAMMVYAVLGLVIVALIANLTEPVSSRKR
jgi:hypothetical protein